MSPAVKAAATPVVATATVAAVVAIYLHEQVETGEGIFAARAVHDFPVAEAARLVEAGVAIYADDLPPLPSDTLAAELVAARDTIATLTGEKEAWLAERTALVAEVAALKAASESGKPPK